MAWGEVKVEDQRKKFVNELAHSSMSDVCRRFDISRPTGYKWLARHEEEGLDGLYDRSKVPHSQKTISESIENKILKMKHKFPKLGPKKIHVKLLESDENICWPCPSSVGNILSRNGLTIRRKLRKRVAANVPSAFDGTQINEVWCMDFKGTLRTFDNNACDPFTLTDSCSRYLIKCQILKRNNYTNVWAVLETAFREFGLPLYILSDNGPPFATLGAGRLSRLSINLIRAGVKPLWIEPGKPYQNGRHERMHGTMQSYLGKPAANSIIDLKDKLKQFQEYYNIDRPHEALGQKPPGKIYVGSNREWYGKFQSPEYDQEYKVRKVQKCGTMNLSGERIYVGETFYGENVGILEGNEGFEVYYSDVFLGIINKKNKVEFKKLK